MAKRIKVSVDASKLQDLLTEFGEAFNNRTADAIGTQVTLKMKDLIGKGISPIEKHGRFPEYKAPSEERAARKSGKSTKTLKPKYPDTVRSKFPDKKRRPVNLELSGKFLDNLEYWIVGLREKFDVAIGFRKAPYVDYERGHREQANGQGFRPIIPQDEETFVKQIKLIIDGVFKDAVNLYLNKRR